MLKHVLAALALSGAAVAAAPALAAQLDVGAAPAKAAARTAAARQAEAPKLLRVVLPDGRIGLVRYQGEVPPRVVLVPVRHVPVQRVASPFAAFDAMFADMDRQMDAMMRQAAAMAARAPAVPNGVGPNGVTLAGGGAGAAPAGTISRSSFVSVSNGGKTCSRFVQVVRGADGAPQVSETSEGDCDGVAAPPVPAAPAAPAAAPKPVIDARDTI